MQKIRLQIQKLISVTLLILALNFKAYNICALILLLNISKFKNIKSNNKNLRKILIFPKSGGIEDLVESFKDKKNNNIVFLSLPRVFLKKIYSYCFKNFKKHDYNTKLIKTQEISAKKLYVKTLTEIFRSLDKFLKIDGFISFNIFYYAEKYFDEVTINLNKKYIILHKESTFTPLEEKNAVELYKTYNDRSYANKISVYTENQKKILIKSKIADKKQIVVNGCPRSDHSFKLRTSKPKNNIIVFYLIEKGRGADILSKKKILYFKDLYEKTLKYLLEYAKKNPDIKLILKGKTGTHNDLLKSSNLSKNCIFINGGTGEKFLIDAKVVIAFNSTIVFETIACNRNLIIPNFNNENIKMKDLVYKINNSHYFVNSKNQFFKKINIFLNSKYKNRKLTVKEKKVLEYYLGNIDGKSGKRLEIFLRKTIG